MQRRRTTPRGPFVLCVLLVLGCRPVGLLVPCWGQPAPGDPLDAIAARLTHGVLSTRGDAGLTESEVQAEVDGVCTALEFDHVSFGYDETPILTDVSFRAEPGTVTALVGPSGAGKTTIAMLAARFWDVNAGQSRIGTTPLRDIGVAALMDHVAFVFQDTTLLFDTIEENIRMGNAAAPFADVERAVRAAQCHDFIQELEHGYRTLVGEGGTSCRAANSSA